MLTAGLTHRLRLLWRSPLAGDEAATSSRREPTGLRTTVRSCRGPRPQTSEGQRAMMHDNDVPVQLNRLYEEFFERGLQYFFPFATCQPLGADPQGHDEALDGNVDPSVLHLTWLGAQYAFHNHVPFTAHEVRMLDSVRA